MFLPTYPLGPACRYGQMLETSQSRLPQTRKGCLEQSRCETICRNVSRARSGTRLRLRSLDGELRQLLSRRHAERPLHHVRSRRRSLVAMHQAAREATADTLRAGADCGKRFDIRSPGAGGCKGNTFNKKMGRANERRVRQTTVAVRSATVGPKVARDSVGT